MIKQKINIIDFETLYNILNEIKSNLSFNIFNYRKENDFIKDLDNNNKDLINSVIIVKSQSKKLLDHTKVDKRKIIYFESLPLSLTKLVEKINILLIQQRYDYQSKINIKNYILDLNSRTIVNNNKYLKLTEKEIDIILFLNDSKKPEKYSSKALITLDGVSIKPSLVGSSPAHLISVFTASSASSREGFSSG